MATHTTCHVPTEEFALEQTLSSVPALSLTCERVVGSGDGTDPQLVRFRGSDPATLEPVLADDPTVEAFDVLSLARRAVLCPLESSRSPRDSVAHRDRGTHPLRNSNSRPLDILPARSEPRHALAAR